MTKKLEKMINDKAKYESKIVEAEKNIRIYKAEIKKLTVNIEQQKQADIISLLSSHGVDYDRLKEILESDDELTDSVSEYKSEAEGVEESSDREDDLILVE